VSLGLDVALDLALDDGLQVEDGEAGKEEEVEAAGGTAGAAGAGEEEEVEAAGGTNGAGEEEEVEAAGGTNGAGEEEEVEATGGTNGAGEEEEVEAAAATSAALTFHSHSNLVSHKSFGIVLCPLFVLYTYVAVSIFTTPCGAVCIPM
jgi:hypothetical protein